MRGSESSESSVSTGTSLLRRAQPLLTCSLSRAEARQLAEAVAHCQPVVVLAQLVAC